MKPTKYVTAAFAAALLLGTGAAVTSAQTQGQERQASPAMQEHMMGHMEGMTSQTEGMGQMDMHMMRQQTMQQMRECMTAMPGDMTSQTREQMHAQMMQQMDQCLGRMEGQAGSQQTAKKKLRHDHRKTKN